MTDEPSSYLQIDIHTLEDLEVFKASTEGQESLFDFCNKTRTTGGARVLKQRMVRPWSNPANILSTQQAVLYIQNNRAAFSKMPTAYTTSRVEHYLNEVLPIITQTNPLEFAIHAFTMWLNQSRYFSSIALGVQITSGLIHSLRAFIEQVEVTSDQGELGPLLEELNELLAIAKLEAIPVYQVGGSLWNTLRYDQNIRLHERGNVRRLLSISFELDALVSMADVTSEHEFVLPTIQEGGMRIDAAGLVHPFVKQPVANAARLTQEQRVLFLTGPNMAGKTTYIRSVATALYLAHLGMGVPAKSFSFVPAERLFSSISLSDDLRGGVSYFRAEALRVKAIAEAIAAGDRVVALMDEPFKGTNVKDALDASLAILERFAMREDCLFVFSSHLIELAEQVSAEQQIDCRNFEADESEGRLKFDYTLRPGISAQRLGMRVLEEEGVFELLDQS